MFFQFYIITFLTYWWIGARQSFLYGVLVAHRIDYNNHNNNKKYLEIWHLPTLKTSLKQKLFSVSARAIKVSIFYPDPMTSYEQIHEINRRAPPEKMRIYNMALQLHKLFGMAASCQSSADMLNIFHIIEW